MKRKILWLMLSWLIVAALVLSSCGEAVPGEQEEEEEEEEEEPAVGEPQYGGTLTDFIGHHSMDPPDPACSQGNYYAVHWLEYCQDRPVQGDIEKYGNRPGGTGEYSFMLHSYQAPQFLTGDLLESWEISEEQLVWHVRPGIYWAPTKDQMERGVMKEPRELTAEDMVLDIHRFIESPWGTRLDGLMTEDGVYATDRYTLVIELLRYSPIVMYYITVEDRSVYSPPETEEAGPSMWENQIGTGAFMFEEYIVGSHMSFVKNPNYWQKATIDGVKYQMPFVDRVVSPIIPDLSTQVAALRTGKLDCLMGVAPSQWEMLDTTAPELLRSDYYSLGQYVYMRCDEPPFDDVDVRRAMLVGTNMAEFRRLALAEDSPPFWTPFSPANSAVFTPLEELPADIQILYDYNPELAKQMLDDAGYPNGFKTNIIFVTSSTAIDQASLLKEQWAKIGVELTIEPLDTVTYSHRVRDLWPHPDYQGTLFMGDPVADPIGIMEMYYYSGGYANWMMHSNPELDEVITAMSATLDVAEQNRLAKEAAIIALSEPTRVPLSLSPTGLYWWPWLKNYYGELSQHDWSPASLYRYMWIDQDLKAEMGY